MIVKRLFSTPLICDRPEVDTESLKAAILKQRAETAGLKVSNLGGWHSDYGFFKWGGPQAKILGEKIAKLAGDNTRSAGKPPKWRVEAWANVNDDGCSNAPHEHPGNYWSAVFFVDIDPKGIGGELVLHDPRMPALRMHAPQLSMGLNDGEAATKILPKTGDLIIFPAWLSHSVMPWHGGQPRISVAMNLAALPA
jgi:uncharacterized protein (TIGR02466 family)